MMMIKVFVIIAFLSLSNSKSNFMHNLPLGEYRLVYEKMYSCKSNNLIQYNVYLSKDTLNTTHLKGNFTFIIPLDDTVILDGNLAYWDSIGGWKSNAMVYIIKNACTNWKKLLGNVWNTLSKSFNFPHNRCPIPVGTYTSTTGVDIKELEDLNFPKVYFYGKYKLTVKIKNVKNEVLCCSVIEFSLLRPWEKPI
ncbi:uncharacterized protein LOC114122516 [Aphis gossypii]|uniref:MD-2-related lipid-recognition domain-containing protein n=1 Tax=Aphis gossypii TaxID=80765 RepID=A0A9P0NPG7_APHGO|nr:uncharacterized protein LOC114122516 [Aphis gossypii]CAH1731475.1 unnamed protein product [Aphis gossypii]